MKNNYLDLKALQLRFQILKEEIASKEKETQTEIKNKILRQQIKGNK